ncbi:MAG: tetrahydromethanopterin S-methyltransferase subunit A [Nitrosarchaeum sp.]|jgi:tetrahydromethanopterin S-methyltransferase subunit A|uniref:tetrahydromethanopterin S-methyltransferase subunit A n=1 Tax=Nitrosarchaeum sp. TaxID=2026886 RepID=UPI002DE5CFE8|nr:tetrahydromethanopterin S-methyltransferase subunit A [Nitrosarchaeum sp.]
MNSIGNAIGELCKIILPIPEESYLGNPDSAIAICTLSSMDLLKKISSSELLNHISIAGRLLSENKGIDSIVKYLNQNKKVKMLIVCGKEVWGHKAGHSLIKLYENGINDHGKIINSISPDPFLTSTKSEINYFQNEINLVNIINETNLETIKKYVN